MTTVERRPESKRGGAIEAVQTSMTPAPSLSAGDAEAPRIDFWDADLLDSVFGHGTMPPAVAMVEHDRRWDAACEAFPADDDRYDGHDLSAFDGSEDPGSASTDEWFDRVGRHVRNTRTGRGADDSVAQALMLLDVAEKADQWATVNGTPYALPEHVGVTRSSVDKGMRGLVLEAARAALEAHAEGGHAESSSVFCRECTPHPALAVWALEALPSRTRLQQVVHSQTTLADRMRREALERRGTVSLAVLAKRAEDQPPALFGLIPARGVTLLVGRTGTLKTFLALHFAATLATDEAGSRVVFGAGEGVDSIGRRVVAKTQELGVSLDALGRRLTVVEAMPDLYDRDEAFDDVLARCRRERPALVVLDHLAVVSGAADQDRATAMTRVMRSAHDLAEASGGAVLVIAHEGARADRGVRGSTAVEDQADAVLTVSRRAHGPVVKITVTKSRDGATGQVVAFRTRPACGSLVLDPIEPADVLDDDDEADSAEVETLPIEAQILAVLDEAEAPLRRGALVALLDGEVSDSTVRRRLGALVEDGAVETTGAGRNTAYRLAGAPA